ncbi:MAG: hypothetical protein EOM80_09285 [Erysipelotrichia bacterium]|nr:hypothetical protein [Erysipelotrichia bacterium]
MKNNNKVFAEIEAVDTQMLHCSKLNDSFYVRQRSADRIALFSLTGHMINMVTAPNTCGPNFILCKRLPPLSEVITEEGWLLDNGNLTIPFMTQINLTNCPRFNSAERFAIGDFPGHMKNLISRRIRQPDFAHLHDLDKRIKNISISIREHLTESAEIPLIKVLGFGSGEVADGDAALCGMLLTARCFVLGKRFKKGWFQRLAVEIRRMLHRASAHGKNWLRYATEGRMTENQQFLFAAMSKDFECASEAVIKKIIEDKIINGKAFLAGVNLTLEMIQDGFFNR